MRLGVSVKKRGRGCIKQPYSKQHGLAECMGLLEQLTSWWRILAADSLHWHIPLAIDGSIRNRRAFTAHAELSPVVGALLAVIEGVSKLAFTSFGDPVSDAEHPVVAATSLGLGDEVRIVFDFAFIVDICERPFEQGGAHHAFPDIGVKVSLELDITEWAVLSAAL